MSASTVFATSQILAAAQPARTALESGVFSVAPANDFNGGRYLPPNSPLVTYYISDPQFEFLSRRGFTHNPLLKWLLEPADRNVILTQTAPLWVDELLRQRMEENKAHAQCGEVKGDVADTPLRSEIKRLEHILNRRGLPVEGYARGNHSSGNVFGVINLSSPWYHRVRNMRWFPFSLFRFSLDEQLEGAAEKPGDILRPQATMEAMHRILNNHREEMPKPKRISARVHAADGNGYQLLRSDDLEVTYPFSSDRLEETFKTFWRASKGTQTNAPRETRFWECVVNYDIADERQEQRGTEVNPIYLQASETARFTAEDGSEYPVYTISLDGLDHKNLVAAVGAGVTEFQTRLIETFMDRMLKENPNARFKISSHFSAAEIVDVPWYMPWRRRGTQQARDAFRKLLQREEVILFSYGHTHRRDVRDLNATLKLKRKSSLIEINAPSLIDYHPNDHQRNGDTQDARALVVEKLKFVEDQKGRRLTIDLEYRGLDEKDMVEGRTAAVDKALEDFERNHGYNRAKETVKELRNKHVIGWLKSHAKRFGEFLGNGVFRAAVNPKKWWNYWKDLTVAQYAIDNFTVVSTVNMFNEARHMIAFLESVATLIGTDPEPGQRAVRAQLLGLRMLLLENAYVRQQAFEKALANGERPSELKKYNDLFAISKTYRVADLLLRLKPGSPARAFAILASIRASREEFQKRRFFFFKVKPTTVANQLPTIEVPLPGVSSGRVALTG